MSGYNRLKAYHETNIKTASQGKIVVMLYDEAVKQLDFSLEELEKKTKKLDLVNNAILKAQDVITELMVSLDFDRGGEIAKNLFSLYMFFNRQLMEANISKDKDLIAAVRKNMAELREAWTQIIHKTSSEGTAGAGGVNIAG